MIAYNKKWLDNLQVQNATEAAVEAACITTDEAGAIKQAYPVGFYTPNIFIRIGLFILTGIIASFSFGLFSLFFISSSSEAAFSSMLIFFSLVCYAAAELMIKNKNHFRSGVDDALIWMTGLFFVSAINISVNMSATANCLLILVVSSYLALRFTDSLMSLVAFLAALGTLVFFLPGFGLYIKAILPFVLMALTATSYFIARSLSKKASWQHYHHCINVIIVASLLCFCFAGNYFIVREAGIALLGLALQPGDPMAFGWLFWIFTVIIPVLYIVRGLHIKDSILLRTGLILIALLAWTIRFYYHVMPLETVMIIGGVLLITIAYAVIKYLAEPKHGFTYKEQSGIKINNDLLNAEALVIVDTFNPIKPADGGFQFGGGSGGGAGAGGTF